MAVRAAVFKNVTLSVTGLRVFTEQYSKSWWQSFNGALQTRLPSESSAGDGGGGVMSPGQRPFGLHSGLIRDGTLVSDEHQKAVTELTSCIKTLQGYSNTPTSIFQ
ncbi:AFG1-like ATPase, partial [Lates japonicus]